MSAHGGREVGLHVFVMSALMKANRQIHAPAALNPGNRPQNSMTGRLGGLQTRSGLYKGKTNVLPMPATESPFPGCSALSLVTILTELCMENFVWQTPSSGQNWTQSIQFLLNAPDCTVSKPQRASTQPLQPSVLYVDFLMFLFQMFDYWRVGIRWDVMPHRMWPNGTVPYVISPLYGECDFSTLYMVPLKPSGYYIYHQFNSQKFYVLPTQCICVLCGSENKQRLFHCTALTGWFL